MYYKIIHAALERKDLKKVKDYVDRKYVPDQTKTRILKHAVRKGHWDVIEHIVQKHPSVLKSKDIRTDAILRSIVKSGDVKMLKHLVEEQSVDNIGDAVNAAIENDRLDILKYLIEERKVDVNEPANDDLPLFVAIRLGKSDIIRYFIEEKKANISTLNAKNETILYPAVRGNNLEFLKYALDEKKKPIDVNWRNTDGETLVHVAAKHRRLKVLRYLVGEKHANIDTPTLARRETALHYALDTFPYDEFDVDLFEYLLKHGANINAQNSKGDNILHSKICPPFLQDENDAARMYKITKYLVDYGIDINQRNGDGETPLHCAASSYMLEFHAPHNDLKEKYDVFYSGFHQYNEDKCKPFKDQYESCKYLVERGAPVNVKNNRGRTPLHCAVHSDKISALLIEHGADVNEKNMYGETPLHVAVFIDHYAVCKLLVKKSADVNAKDFNGETPVHVAVQTHNIIVLDYLVDDNHADINIPRKGDNFTPLHCAASLVNDMGAVRYLIDHGANTTAKSKDGRTPSQVAARPIDVRKRRSVGPPCSGSLATPAVEINPLPRIARGGGIAAFLNSNYISFGVESFLTLAQVLVRNSTISHSAGQINQLDRIAEIAVHDLPNFRIKE